MKNILSKIARAWKGLKFGWTAKPRKKLKSGAPFRARGAFVTRNYVARDIGPGPSPKPPTISSPVLGSGPPLRNAPPGESLSKRSL